MRRQGGLVVLWSLVALVHRVGAVADHYRSLGVPRDASHDAIKAAYRKIALKHHPDKMKRDASAETRKASQRIFEDANVAMEILGDPAQRRQYDFDLANPIQEGPDGIYRQGPSGAQERPQPPRPVVEVVVACTLKQFGGWEDARVTLSAYESALGTAVPREIATALQLPLRLPLPPGSAPGDVIRCDAPARARRDRYRLYPARSPRAQHPAARQRPPRHHTLPAWHNLIRPAVSIQGVDGGRLHVRARGQRVRAQSAASRSTRQRGDVVSIPGAGMPIRGTGDAAQACERGDVHVEFHVRGAGREALRASACVGGAAAMMRASRFAIAWCPVVAHELYDWASIGVSAVHHFLSLELLGRWSRENRATRAEAESKRRAARQRARAERKREGRRREAARQRSKLRQRWRAASEPWRDRIVGAWRWAFDPSYEDAAPGGTD